ncbi:imelysin family protein [Tropicimonas isoalkanivorans]|uniref:Imelysin n=1 Tax=Tropicimonas isoalkanivorans TaxID=441112 RepID=A0A1I1L0P3_9RHOB|nr:imelysin family protein [Tropicimonas isoalkanivorans]SFC66636.1 Imelysin [Tropicimonas isoalkanivorans]
MIRSRAVVFSAAILSAVLVVTPAAHGGSGRTKAVNEDLGLPYWPPGRGEVDHAALRRRSLEVLDRQFGAFRDATAELAVTAAGVCDGSRTEDDVKAALRRAWLTWAPLDSYQFGPVEQLGAALTVNFWPDKKDFVGRGLDALLALPPDAQRDPETVAAMSAAAQGLPALERLLYTDLEPCPAIVGISGFLSGLAQDLHDAWFAPNGWADIARAAGPENPVYLSPGEFTATLYTAVDFGLTRVAEARLGRPLGTGGRSYPRRTEAWRSGLSDEIVAAQLAGLAELIETGFAGDLRETDRAWILTVFAQALNRQAEIGDPLAEAVTEPDGRARVEALQTKIRYLQLEVAKDVGPNLGVDTGFSAADGD